jgi:CRISPR-associated exonuclease Cas4
MDVVRDDDQALGSELSESEAMEPVHISALEHYSYCPRQCALIHIEQTFDENIYTLRGRMLHERVEEAEAETQGAVRIERALPLWSKRLGLIGKADVVEFHPVLRGSGEAGGEVPYPVEYKLGPRRSWKHAALQVCAQGLCLEEMTGQTVPRGAIYHHGSRRRTEVSFDAPLRQRVEDTVVAVRHMLAAREVPQPVNDSRCRLCSLRDSCLPSAAGRTARVKALARSLFSIEEQG